MLWLSRKQTSKLSISCPMFINPKSREPLLTPASLSSTPLPKCFHPYTARLVYERHIIMIVLTTLSHSFYSIPVVSRPYIALIQDELKRFSKDSEHIHYE